MSRVPLEWFRDEDGWTTPTGRRGELVALAVAVPSLALVAYAWTDLLQAGRHWPVASVGVLAGVCYAWFCREYVLGYVREYAPDDVGSWTILSLFGGGIGVPALESIPAAGAVVALLLAAGGTILAVYLLRLVSPLHEGVQPLRRGADPPSAVDVDG